MHLESLDAKEAHFASLDCLNLSLNPNLNLSSLEIHSHPNTPKVPPQYIHFLDSDDYLSLDCVSECVKVACKEEVDLIFYGSSNFIDPQCDLEESLKPMQKDLEHTEENHQGFLRFYKQIKEGEIYPSLKVLEEHICGNYLAFSVGCQIRFEIIKEIRFFEGIMAEDALFAPILLSQARSALFLKSAFYHRRIRPFSITDFGNQHTKETLPVSLNDICQAIHEAKDAKVYYLAYSSACLCSELYLYFFIQNQYSKEVINRVNDLILDRIVMAFEALHFEADPRNARARLEILEHYLVAAKLSSKIAYRFPRVFRILKGIKKGFRKMKGF